MAGVKGKGGKKGASGRKPKFDEQELLDLLGEAWPKAARLKTIKKLVALANEGDREAAKILLDRAYGKPKERHEHGGEGGGPVELIVRYVGKK